MVARGAVLSGVVGLSVVLLAGAAWPGESSRPIGYWEKLPPPLARADYFHDIGIEPGGTLWAMGGNTLAHWDGKQFREPQEGDLRSGQFLAKFYGGPDRGLYVTQRGGEEHRGRIFRLSDGTGQPVADFFYQSAADYPGVYVSKSGRLFNWGKDFLAFYTGQQWEKSEAKLSETPSHTLVFDTGESVYFYGLGRLYSIDARKGNAASEVPVRWPEARAHVCGALWGNDKALLLQYATKGVHAVELATGRLVDVQAVNRAMGDCTVYDLFADRDGEVWVLANHPELRSCVFYRIAPDGRVTLVRESAGFGWDNNQFWSHRASVLHAGDGAFWFALIRQGALYYKDGRTHLFDGSEGWNLAGCWKILEDGRGRTYTLSSHGVYAFHAGRPAPDEPAEHARRPIVLPETAWKFEPPKYRRIKRALKIGDTLALTTSETAALILLDAASGRQRAVLKEGALRSSDVEIAPGRTTAELLVVTGDGILAVDAASGAVLRTTQFRADRRIHPIPLGEDYLVVPGYRSGSLARIDAAGKVLWESRLPGYAMVHPAVGGATAVVQTRQGSYGGQATTAFDVSTGKQLWTETTNAYGCGAVFAGDASCVVEADEWLSPKATEGWIIGRDPRTGAKLWHYRHPTTTDHQPLLDAKNDRAFAAFAWGEVVCLRAKDGALAWKTALPEGPYPSPASRYEHPYWPVLALDGEKLLAIDSNEVLHALSAADGRLLASVDLIGSFRTDGRRTVWADLLAMPWLDKERLTAVTSRGVVAYLLR